MNIRSSIAMPSIVRFPTLRRLQVFALASALAMIVILYCMTLEEQSEDHTSTARIVATNNDELNSIRSRPTDEADTFEKIANETIVNGEAALYVYSIFNPLATNLARLACRPHSTKRYAHLQIAAQRPLLLPSFHPNTKTRRQIKYFFVLNLRTVAPLLPRLLGSITDAIRFLGPQSCALSIVEGNSEDVTWEILTAIQPGLVSLGMPEEHYTLVSSELNPSNTEHRIKRLAMLRNLALAPVREAYAMERLDADAHIVYLNDVAICSEDILELVHQRVLQAADMTCAMDWAFHAPDANAKYRYPVDHGSAEFYDVWVARTLSGDSFFHISPEGSWDEAWKLFPNESDQDTRHRYEQMRPFQVFSCWNGGVVIAAAAVAGPKSVRFRVSVEGEAFHGEPTLWCKDMWRRGLGRIAVVPTVNLEYTDEKSAGVKFLKGYTSDWTKSRRDEQQERLDRIQWRDEPPEKVRSWWRYEEQDWRPWREPFEESDAWEEGWKMYPGDRSS